MNRVTNVEITRECVLGLFCRSDCSQLAHFIKRKFFIIDKKEMNKTKLYGRKWLGPAGEYSVSTIIIVAAIISIASHLFAVKPFAFPLSATILMVSLLMMLMMTMTMTTPMMMMIAIVIADFTHAHSTYVCMVCAYVYVTFVLANRNSIPCSLQGWLYFRGF